MYVGTVKALESSAPSASATSASTLRKDFLRLFLQKLQTQNPLEPMDDQAMMAQLSQLASLEAMQGIGSTLEGIEGQGRFGEASALLGKEVFAVDPTSGESLQGVVEEVRFQDGGAWLVVGGRLVPLGAVSAFAPAAKEGA